MFDLPFCFRDVRVLLLFPALEVIKAVVPLQASRHMILLSLRNLLESFNIVVAIHHIWNELRKTPMNRSFDRPFTQRDDHWMSLS